jgi:hypothetical protein
MLRRALLTGVLLVLPGCSFITTATNQAPEAFIDSISPRDATVGAAVTFTGHGTDADGSVVGYLWQSDRDGQLSRLPDFTTDSLSAGTHGIEFMVQDNTGAWSIGVEDTVTIRPAPAKPVLIESFSPSATTVAPGERVVLSWDVENATSVSIDQGVGAVDVIGSAVVNPQVTTTYTLEASGPSSTATASLTVRVQSSMHAMTLEADRQMSGYIRQSGAYTMIGLYTGDDQANRGLQAFVTFDISDIPEHATITKVLVDMSGYDIPYDNPFPDLECLAAYVYEYNSLYGAYWTGSLRNPIGEWCSLEDLDTPREFVGFREALQEELGENRFQFRLQFGDRTDSDEERDLVHWARESLPTMTVEYDSDDA